MSEQYWREQVEYWEAQVPKFLRENELLRTDNEQLRSVIGQLRAALKDVYERAVLPIDLAARVRGALEEGEWLDIADRALALKGGK